MNHVLSSFLYQKHKRKKLSAEERSDGAKATHQNFLLYLFAFEVEGASNLKSRFSKVFIFYWKKIELFSPSVIW